MANYTDESAADGLWGDGDIWQIGEVGIYVGMAWLFIGKGISHRTATFADESASAGAWSGESI